MFTVEAFPATELGNASFLLVDRDHGVGLVVDPYRDVDGYLTRAESLGIKLTHALDTHLHNDFDRQYLHVGKTSGPSVFAQPAWSHHRSGACGWRIHHADGKAVDSAPFVHEPLELVARSREFQRCLLVRDHHGAARRS